MCGRRKHFPMNCGFLMYMVNFITKKLRGHLVRSGLQGWIKRGLLALWRYSFFSGFQLVFSTCKSEIVSICYKSHIGMNYIIGSLIK